MQRIRAAAAKSYERVRAVPDVAAKQIENTVDTARTWIYKLILTAVTAAILVFASIFMYGSFYISFVPAAAHEAPLHLVFEPCVHTSEKCGFLNASLSLNMLSGSGSQGGRGGKTERNSPVLMAGQAYAVVVALDMPESPKNLDLGMFMSCLQMRSPHPNRPNEGGIIRSTCKSSMLQYRSLLLRLLETFTLAPFYMSGHVVEKQTVFVEFFNDFTDNPLNPAVKVVFELQSRLAEVYNARLIIHAKFGGLRYYMYYYPATAAIIGSTLNFLVLAFVILLSWLRFFAPSQYVDETDDYKKVDELDDHIENDKNYKQENADEENGDEETEDSESKSSSDLVVIKGDDSNQIDSEEDMAIHEYSVDDKECKKTN